jgi:CRP-like cAMP-binding protein
VTTAAGSREVTGFLADLRPETQALLRSGARRRRYTKGTTLVHQGVVPDRVLIVLSGRIKVARATEDGREALFAFAADGDLVGELSAIDGSPYSATVTALEPVEALVIPHSDFKRLLEQDATLSLAVLRVVARRLRGADRQRVDFAALDTVGRVARGLLELAERFGERAADGVRITLPISQEELAGWTGSSREAVSRSLQVLRQAGWVRTERRCITVLDPEALRRRVAV